MDDPKATQRSPQARRATLILTVIAVAAFLQGITDVPPIGRYSLLIAAFAVIATAVVRYQGSTKD